MTQVKVLPSGMPSDATHIDPYTTYAKWYKCVDGVWKYWIDQGCWRNSSNTAEQLKRLIPR